MDLAIHWSGDWPEHFAALIEALQDFYETAGEIGGELVLCPDASAVPPPQPGVPSVAGVCGTVRLFTPGGRRELGKALEPWMGRGAFFVVPTAAAATALATLPGMAGERVRVLPLPLGRGRMAQRPDGEAPGSDILAIGPVDYGTTLSALRALRLMKVDARLVVADLAHDGIELTRPAGVLAPFRVLGGYDVVHTREWRPRVADAGAILLGETHSDLGWTLREALSTGRPVVTPSSALVADQLAAAGAHAYMYEHGMPVELAGALRAALARDRGRDLERHAAAAVEAESWALAAGSLHSIFTEALAPSASPTRSSRPPAQARVTREALAVAVLNPWASGGGGERFFREMVEALCAHPSRPQVTAVAALPPGASFDAGADALERAGASVAVVPQDAFDVRTADILRGVDVAYCAWSALTRPPPAPVPLVCTLHDLNHKHFGVLSDEQKAALERQIPEWLRGSHTVVSSSEFIRAELEHFYAVRPGQTAVIPLTVRPHEGTVDPEERALVRRRFGLPAGFVLSPAGRHLHKNYPALDAALRLLRRRGRPITVAASGEATELGYWGPDLIGLGYVSARELEALYADCAGVVQTTLYEAGSWPMLEAMAALKPVACSRIPPIVEQIERLGLRAELFDPHSPAAIADSLARLVAGTGEPQAREANRRAVTARTWEHVAGDYLDVFRQAVKEARC